MKNKINLLIILLAMFLVAGFSCDKNSEGDVIDNIQDAMESNQKMKCTYTDNDLMTTSYIQGKKYRTEYTLDEEAYVNLFNGETVYSWNEITKEGNKLQIDCLGEEGKGDDEDTPAPTDDSPQLETYNLKKWVDYYKADDIVDNHSDIECRTASTIDFSVPTDIDFYDQCPDIQKMNGYTDPSYESPSDDSADN
jgi:hypothetical protein